MSDLVLKVMREVQTWIAPMLGRIKEAETIGEWKARKKAQAMRFMIRDQSFGLDCWTDYGTTFLLGHASGATLIIGRLKGRIGPADPGIDLTDEEIAREVKLIGAVPRELYRYYVADGHQLIALNGDLWRHDPFRPFQKLAQPEIDAALASFLVDLDGVIKEELMTITQAKELGYIPPGEKPRG